MTRLKFRICPNETDEVSLLSFDMCVSKEINLQNGGRFMAFDSSTGKRIWVLISEDDTIDLGDGIKISKKNLDSVLDDYFKRKKAEKC